MGKIVINEKIVEETLDILTCPFCGSEDLRLRDGGRGHGYYNYSVVCNRCKTVGPSAGQSLSFENDNKEIAVRLWNNRTWPTTLSTDEFDIAVERLNKKTGEH